MPDLFCLLQSKFTDLPADQISNLQTISARYFKNTLGHEISLQAGIKLSQVSDIKTLVKLANENDFIIQPVSSGNNWGYGSVAINESERAVVLLDLSMMNKITPIDKTLGLIAIEPGVTQQQLFDYLANNGWNYMTPVTGAGPTCSILSNALERGYGITPHTDHFYAVTRMSAILPHPDLCDNDYQSAVAAMDKSNEKIVDHTFKWGLGPHFEGLLTQSNFGIVTEMTIRLAKRPEAFTAFYIKVNDPTKLANCVAFIQNTLQDFEGIVGSINLMDKRRVLSMVVGNPNGPDNHRIMSDQQVQQLAKENQVAEWMIVGSIYGRKNVVRSVKRLIRKSAGFSSQIIFSDGLLIKAGKLASKLFNTKFLKAASEQLQALDEGIDIMLGKPQQVALPLAYWRNPRTKVDKTRNMNPDKDDCGLLWYAPLVHMNAEKIVEYVDFIRTTTPKYNIEPLITFTNLKHDCIDSTIPIVYDVKNPKAKQAAFDCLDELYEEGRKRGFVPYRMNVKQQREKLDPQASHWKVIRTLKAAIDPNNIIAPGRYNP